MYEPYSEQQERWAFAAEARGELPTGTALRWARRAKRRALGDLATVQISSSPDGWPQSKATVKKIGALIRQYSHHPLIRQVATRICKDIPSKQPTVEIDRIYQWVRRNIRFRYDPIGIEWLQTPTRTLTERSGDCDCITTLIGSLCRSIGHPVALRTVGRAKTSPSHVSALVYDRKRWISLDPILEGPGDVGQERPGHFATYAPGPAVVWNLEGKPMLGNYSDLGITPTAQDMTLWQFAPAFRVETAAPGPTRIYSREHSATFGHSPECRSHQIPLSDLAYYWLPSDIDGEEFSGYVSDLGMWGIFKKIGKIAKGIGKIVGKIASAAAPIVSMVPGVGTVVGPALAAGGATLTALTKIGEKGKGEGAPQALTPIAPMGAPAALSKTPITAEAPADITRQLTALAAQQKEQGKAIAYLPAISTAVEVLPAALPAVTDRLSNLIDYMKAKDKKALKAAAAKAAKAKSAKARSAAISTMRKIARTEMRKAKVKGSRLQLADFGLAPAISFSFSGYGDIATARAAAQRAIDRVIVFVSKVGKPPEVSLPEVKAFQVADGKLTPDGLYGPNAKTAAQWYLQRAVPAHSPRFKNAVTWKPPVTAPAQVTTIQMEPARVVVPRPAAPIAIRPAPVMAPAARPAPVAVRPAPVMAPAARPAIVPVRTAPVAITQPAIAPILRQIARPTPTPQAPLRIRPQHHAKISTVHAAVVPALLPTRAEIVKLEIAAARGDTALLRAMAKVEKTGKARAKKLVKKLKAAGKKKTPASRRKAAAKAINTPPAKSKEDSLILPIALLFAMSQR